MYTNIRSRLWNRVAVVIMNTLFSAGYPDTQDIKLSEQDISANSIAVVAPLPDPTLTINPVKTFFEEQHASVKSPSGGDLWPSCWSNDGALYAFDIAVSRITGSPWTNDLAGTILAHGDAVGKIWHDEGYNRKPTGMLCVNGEIYVAVQDLQSKTFLDAPAASISKSTDHGLTWTFDRAAPMFDNWIFTTIFFLDFGKDQANSFDPSYVYAYAIDNSWQYSDKLYLAKVPRTSVMSRSTWLFYSSLDANNPTRSSNIANRQPVLVDSRILYARSNLVDPTYDLGPPVLPLPNGVTIRPIGQGGVIYDHALNRYIYTSFARYSHIFYQSPTPWGPWKLLKEEEFGLYKWTTNHHGGYAPTIPSKFISADGKQMWMQSNTVTAAANQPGFPDVYSFAVRKVVIKPADGNEVSNPQPSPANLARVPGATPLFRAARQGHPNIINDGIRSGQHEDSWLGVVRPSDYWGVTWAHPYNVNKVVYIVGNTFLDGGWFESDLRVQARTGGVWVDIRGGTVSPVYPYNSTAALQQYTFTFAVIVADGIRIVGVPGGSAKYTSIQEFEVFYY
jgi:hypothetical protein